MNDALTFRFIMEDGGGSPSSSPDNSAGGGFAGPSPPVDAPSGTQPAKPVRPGQVPPPDGNSSPGGRGRGGGGSSGNVPGGQIDRAIKDLVRGFESVPVFGQFVRAAHSLVDPILRNAEVVDALRESLGGWLTNVRPGQVPPPENPASKPAAGGSGGMGDTVAPPASGTKADEPAAPSEPPRKPKTPSEPIAPPVKPNQVPPPEPITTASPAAAGGVSDIVGHLEKDPDTVRHKPTSSDRGTEIHEPERAPRVRPMDIPIAAAVRPGQMVDVRGNGIPSPASGQRDRPQADGDSRPYIPPQAVRAGRTEPPQPIFNRGRIDFGQLANRVVWGGDRLIGPARRAAGNRIRKIAQSRQAKRVRAGINRVSGRAMRKLQPITQVARAGMGKFASVVTAAKGVATAAGSAVAGGVQAGGAIVAGAIGAMGPLGLFVAGVGAAAAGLVLLTKAAVELDRIFRQRADQLEPFSPDIILARARNQIAELQDNISAARRLGPNLGQFEESRAGLSRSLQRIEDALVNGLLSSSNDALRLLSNIVEIASKFAPVAEAGGKAFVDTIIDSLFPKGSLFYKLARESGLLDKLNSAIDEYLNKSKIDGANDILGIFDQSNRPALPVQWGGKTYTPNGQQVGPANTRGQQPNANPLPVLGL